MPGREQAAVMLRLQSRMNARVNPDWVAARHPYLRAVVVEGAEAMEHHGWKWWKKQERDLEQLRMELIDIWHFFLSHLLLEAGGDEHAAAARLLALARPRPRVDFDGKTFALDELDTLAKLELTTGLAAAGRLDIPLFAALLADCGMDWQDLFCRYVGKNVLNFFRQDHGYKEGSYRKVWGGREDNAHLVEAMAELDSAREDYQEALYARLKARYEEAGG